MTRVGQIVRNFIAPDIPDAIRDEYILFTARHVQDRGRLLFGALLLTAPAAYYAAAPDASAWVSIGAPLVTGLLFLLGYLNLSRDLHLANNVYRSRKLISSATISSSLIAVMCSAWCVFSWLGAPPGERIYYPLIIALGAFSTAYCMSAVRVGACANIVINIAPMIVLLVSSGYRLDLAAAVSLLIASAFQLHMITQHQQDIINLLSLQRQSRELALTDPLTGLLNRRALLDNAVTMGEHAALRLMLVDIDHFKAINDGHGHDMGDAVLVIVAERLAQQAEIRASVARIGGEEFAILGTAEELPDALALAVLADIRTTRMPHGKQVTVSIGVAEGTVFTESGWRELFNRADFALYRAKTDGRNRMVQAAPPAPSSAAAAA